MIEKELLIRDLQEQLRKTEDEQTKVILANIISDVISGKYNIRVW
jgi:hypothetical protein